MKQVNAIWFPDRDEHFSKMIDVEGNYQKKAFDLACSYLPSKDVFVDIGAHVGLQSMMAYRANFSSLIAFEPNKENYECLVKNINDHTEFYNVELENIILSEKKGNYSEIIDKDNNTGALHFEKGGEIYADTLDDRLTYRMPAPDPSLNFLIKIDVQGMEEDVLMGARNTILKYRPVILIETIHSNVKNEKIDEILTEFGMTCKEIINKDAVYVY